MQKINYLKLALVFGIILSFGSCDDDFLETGSGLINTIELPPLYETDNIVAYSKEVDRVQSNFLTKQTLADYQDPVFGNIKGSLLTQLLLSSTGNDFGTDPVLDSVVLTLPYYSRLVETDQYVLDSVQGEGEFFIKVFRSNHLLRSIDPGPDGEFNQDQVYYSDQLSTFQPNIETLPLAEEGPFRFEDFTESLELIQRSGAEVIDTLSVSPRIRIKLPAATFQELIFDKIGQPELASNSNFVNFFRGIHIVLESAGGEGALAAFNVFQEDANVTLHYNTQRPRPVTEENPEEELETVYNRFRLSLGEVLEDGTITGIRVNLFEQDFLIDASTPNTEEGDENLYLKGGQGYYSVIELFTGPDSDGDGVSDELQDLRDRNILVNEANLEFFVNEEVASTSANRVNRIILFNVEDNTVLIDYIRDRTAGDIASTSRISHLGPLTNVDAEGRQYRLRITEHLNQIINQDSTNVKLGLMVTENVNNTIQLEAETEDDEINRIFRSTVQYTKGTVLHGSNSPVEEKRVKLKLQVTEIN